MRPPRGLGNRFRISNLSVTEPAESAVAGLERDFWRSKAEALERIIGTKVPALATWLKKQDRAILERAHSPDWRLMFLNLTRLYGELAPPKKLTGHRPRKNQAIMNEPILLLISFEKICRNLHRLWRKGKIRTGINDLMSNHLPKVYRDIGIASHQRPTKSEIEKWSKASSVETFAYALLAHARGMGVEYLKRVISKMRSQRKEWRKTFGGDVLPEDLRDWRRQTRLSSSYRQPK